MTSFTNINYIRETIADQLGGILDLASIVEECLGSVSELCGKCHKQHFTSLNREGWTINKMIPCFSCSLKLCDDCYGGTRHIHRMTMCDYCKTCEIKEYSLKIYNGIMDISGDEDEGESSESESSEFEDSDSESESE